MTSTASDPTCHDRAHIAAGYHRTSSCTATPENPCWCDCHRPPPAYVVDRHGEVWKIVRDGGMVSRVADYGVESAGLAWAESNIGPLLPFDGRRYRSECPRAEV